MTRGLRKLALTAGAIALTGAFALSAAGPAIADPVPNPGTPGPFYSPDFTASLFSTPTSGLRPKYRWWVPVADTNDSELQKEVGNIGVAGAGGYEQNGFPINMNPGGQTTQFQTWANSQEFLQTYGWGTPLWSHHTEVSENAAAQDGLIGDMNEGSRWNNTVPTVYSLNQAAVAQDLSYGDAQYLPGQNPSGELPPTTPALGGVSTRLTAQANPGNTNIQLQSIAGLLAGDQITLGAGSAGEVATIQNVGTAGPAVPLAQAAASGATVVHVAPAVSTTGVPGTAQSAAQFVAGENVVVGSGASADNDVIQSVGTYDIATTPTTLAAATGAGATNVEVASNANFLKGDTITIDRGLASQESRTIASVGAAGTGTTLALAGSAGDLGIRVASTTGIAAGNQLIINPGGADQETVTVAQTSTAASPAPNLLINQTTLANAHASGEPVVISGIGITLTAALTSAHASGASAIDTGSGITLATPLAHGHVIGDNFIAPGTGVTLTAPLTKVHATGANTRTATTLSAAVTAGQTNIKVASVTGLAVGDQLTIGQPGYSEVVSIAAGGVGTAGATGTGLTLTAATTAAHYSGDPNVDVTNRNSPTTLSAAPAVGGSAPFTMEVANATGYAVGDSLTIGAPGFTETKTISAIGTAGAGPDGGTVITVNSAFTIAHSTGDAVVDSSNPGANGSAGVSDIEQEKPVLTELIQCLAPTTAAAEAARTTTLAAAVVPGPTANNVKLASVTSLSPGDTLVFDSGAAQETGTIAAGGVGTAGATGTGVTLTAGLTQAHASGASVWDTCPSAASGLVRELDPTTGVNVSGQVAANALNWTAGTLNYSGGTLPAGNGQPWELIDLYSQGDTQNNAGGVATTPAYWLSHITQAGAKVMTDYFDANVLNDPATVAAIAYQDAHTGTPAVFEDSLEIANNMEWAPNMVSAWSAPVSQGGRGYDPTLLLPVLANTGLGSAGTALFDFPMSDGQGATLGWRVREDYRQMWSNLFTNVYEQTFDDWASAHGLVARFQAYSTFNGQPAIDPGQATAHQGIAEGEGLNFTSDAPQMFKEVASGTYMTGNKVVSDECCAQNSAVWGDSYGLDGTGTGAAGASNPLATLADSNLVGGVTQMIWHGWPYTPGVAGTSAVWPGFTYGGDTSFSAAYGPNQPQISDWTSISTAIGRAALAMRQGQPAFDVGVYNGGLGLPGLSPVSLAGGEGLGTVISGGVTQTSPTTGKIIRSSSSLAQAGYSYGYLSPEFFRYPTAIYGPDPNEADQGGTGGDEVLFAGHGDYKALIIYDTSVMAPDVAQTIAALAGQGLPIVIVGPVPNAALSASGTSVAAMQAADSQVQTAMAQVTAAPNTRIVTDLTSAGSASSDGNVPAALTVLGIGASMAQTPSATATPLLAQRRHTATTDYYEIYNPQTTATAYQTVTLTGNGVPYSLNTWAGTITPIANYTSAGNHVTLSVRVAPANLKLIAISTANLAQGAGAPTLHATSTTANASPSTSDNVQYNAGGALVARAASTGSYTTTRSDGASLTSPITVPSIGTSPGAVTLTSWQLSVDSWGPPPSGDPTQTQHTPIPATGTFAVAPLTGVSTGVLPSWVNITPQNGFPSADNLTDVAGIGTYTTTVTLPAGWAPSNAGAYLNIGVAVDTVKISVNATQVPGVDENDRNQVDVGPWLHAGANTITIAVATPLRDAVVVAPATPATGQVANSSAAIGTLQGGNKLTNVGLIGPVTLTPYGVSSSLNLTASAALSPATVAGYFNHNPSVVLSATDAGGPGVAAITYQIDGGAVQTYAGAFQITGDGSHTLQYGATDTGGDSVTAPAITVLIDTTAPTTTASVSPAPSGGQVSGPATVTLTPTDATSGVASTSYTIDGGATHAYAGPFTITSGGAHTITYWSTDVAGNTETVHTLAIQVDPIATTTPSGSVPGTLALSVGSTAPNLPSFTPGKAQTYATTVAATVTTTAASSTLTATDLSAQSPGYLVNTAASGGPYALAQGLQVAGHDSAAPPSSTGSDTFTNLATTNPATLLSYFAPVSNDPVTIGFKQVIGATDPLRTGTYTKTITFTLTTSTL